MCVCVCVWQNGDVFRLKDVASLKPEKEGDDPYLAQIISMWQARARRARRGGGAASLSPEGASGWEQAECPEPLQNNRYKTCSVLQRTSAKETSWAA